MMDTAMRNVMLRELGTMKGHYLFEKKKIKDVIEGLVGYDIRVLRKKLSAINAKLIIIDQIMRSYEANHWHTLN